MAKEKEPEPMAKEKEPEPMAADLGALQCQDCDHTLYRHDHKKSRDNKVYLVCRGITVDGKTHEPYFCDCGRFNPPVTWTYDGVYGHNLREWKLDDNGRLTAYCHGHCNSAVVLRPANEHEYQANLRERARRLEEQARLNNVLHEPPANASFVCRL